MPDVDSVLATVARFAEHPPISAPPEADVVRRARAIRRRRRLRRMGLAALVLVVGAAATTMGWRSEDDGARSVGSDAPPTSPIDPAAFLDEVLDVVAAESYDVDLSSVDTLRSDAAEFAATRPSAEETYRYARDMLDRLTVRTPALLIPPGERRPLPTGAGSPELRPHATVTDGIGYIEVKPIDAEAATDEGTTYVEDVRDLLRADACGWIVDLRGGHDGAGTKLSTTLSALAPLLGPGPTVGYRDRDGATETFLIGDGGAVSVDGERVAPPSDELVPVTTPIAVVQGDDTMANLEGVLMAFRGGAQVRTFGLPSAGHAMATEGIRLSDGSMLHLTTAAGVDRGGTVHTSAIPPDETVPPAGTRTDPEREAAAAWLAGQPGCVSP